MDETDEVVERVARTLRAERVEMSSALDARVMMRVRSEALVPDGRGVWQWLTRPRTVSVSPLAGLALAAGLAAVMVFATRDGDVERVPATAMAPVAAEPGSTEQMTKFVFVAPGASTVAIVGDFNDWEEGASPLRPLEEGVWTISIPLAPGRYQYTFVIDGTTWEADPLAPRTLEDDFGRPNSVITVGEATT